MNREEYDRFYDALVAAEPAETKEWEKLECFAPQAPEAGARGPRFFEGCLPIEELARRGRDTLRFGPMKPVGLRDPQTGKTPWAVVQLRKENLRSSSYNIVGFQNHLKFGDQAHVLRLIPGLENARFLRYGQMHRNTYICAPTLLDEFLRLSPQECSRLSPQICHPEQPDAKREGSEGSASPASRHTIFFAGQICGVEGYTESIATGMLAGIYAAAIAHGHEPAPVPRATALGSLVHYITHAERKNFQPANMTFDLLEPLDEETRRKIRDKKERHRLQCERSLPAFDQWRQKSFHEG
jgi:methylenetetrahydrofolate--tRNA-(uracil-5-)-methyltransferase